MLPIIMNFQRKQQLGPATSYALQIVVVRGEKVLGRVKILYHFLYWNTQIKLFRNIFLLYGKQKYFFF